MMKKVELAEAVYKAAHLTGEFKLRSGQISGEYFDKYLLEAEPGLLASVAGTMLTLIPKDTEVLAGLEMGGIPVATALSLASGLPCAFVRKKAKEYGTCKLAEGADIRGKRVCVVEDVVTTGGQILESVKELRARGAVVDTVLCVIRRNEKAEDILAEAGLTLLSAFTMEYLKNRITTVILDIGQVLADFVWRDYVDTFGFSDEVKQKVISATVGNKAHWVLQDKGVFTDEEYYRECCRLVPGIEAELKLFFDRICGIVVEYDYAAEFVKAIQKAGYKVYLLTNYGKTTFDYAKENFRFIPLVDGMVVSAYEKQVKPEEDIYRTLLTRYQIKPEEAVFLDDVQDNIDTAVRLGIHGIRFENLEQALAGLCRLGVDIDW